MKKIIGIWIILILFTIGFCGCNEQTENNEDDIKPEDMIIGSWQREDNRIWTFYNNGSSYKEIPEIGNYWINYEIHNNMLTEYIFDNPISHEIEFEGNDKLILTNTEDNSVVIYHRINNNED